MKGTTLSPLLLVTAGAAFGLGWMMRPDSEGSGGNTEMDRKALVNKGLRRASSGSRAGGGLGGAEREFVGRYLVDGKISAEDMRAAIEEMSKINDPLERQKMLAALLENLTAENAKEAFLALRENQRGGPFGRGGDESLRLLANAWGRVDGAGAIAALREMAEADDGGDRRGGRGGRGPGGLGGEMMGALAGWATVDAAGATAYLDTIEGDREKGMAGFGVLRGLLVNGVDGAMSFVQNISATEDGGDRMQEMYMGMIAGEILEQGADAAMSWVDTLSDPSLKSGALTRVTMELMGQDREETAEWLLQYHDDEAAAGAVNRFADSWSREDPQAVFEWAEKLSGKTKAEAYEEAMETWAREDPSAAGEYLSNLEASPERDSATEAYATRVSREDPVTAMEWAGTIRDAELKLETQLEVAQDWYRIDRVAAEAWIAAHNLSEEAIKEITSPRRDRRGFDAFR
ncbi:MAG: hypothetical protein ABF334_00255 [Akkermansiaceae bacterium]